MANVNEFSQPIKLLNGGPLDALRGPYATVADACAAIPNVVGSDGKNYRQGKIVDIGNSSGTIQYQWNNGFDDGNLIPILPHLSGYIDKFNSATQVGYGNDRSNMTPLYSIDKGGYYIVIAKGGIMDGQTISPFVNYPIFYKKSENQKIAVEFTLNMTAGGRYPKVKLDLSGSSGGYVATIAKDQFRVVRSKYEILEGFELATYSYDIDMNTILSKFSSLSEIGYIGISATLTLEPGGPTATKETTYYISDTIIKLDKKIDLGAEESMSSSNTILHEITNISYSNSPSGGALENHVGAEAISLPEKSIYRPATFDLRLNYLEQTLEHFGNSGIVYVRFKGENLKLIDIDDSNGYVYNESGVSVKPLFVDTVHGILAFAYVGRYDLVPRFIIQTRVELIDFYKAGKMSIDSISVDSRTFYSKKIISILFPGNNKISFKDDWNSNHRGFSIPYSSDGAAFFGASMDNEIGVLSIPQKLKSINPSYLGVSVNLKSLRSLFKKDSAFGSGDVAVLTWLVKIKIKGNNYNGKDDKYYNGEQYATSIYPAIAPSLNPPQFSLAIGGGVLFPDLTNTEEEPYFIRRCEFIIDPDALGGFRFRDEMNLYLVFGNVAEFAEFDITAETISLQVKNINPPLVDSNVDRFITQTAFAMRQNLVPREIAVATGAIQNYATNIIGKILDTTDTEVSSVSGYIGIPGVATNTGRVMAINVNVKTAAQVVFVCGFIDQHGIIIPSSQTTIDLVAGANVIGYERMTLSPLNIGRGEQLFMKVNNLSFPAKTDSNGSYITASNVSSPVTTTTSGKSLDFRYIVMYAKQALVELPSRQSVKDLELSMNDIIQYGVKIASPNGVKWRISVSDTGVISAQSVKYNKILAIGNSITIHPITSFWWGEWGMAASEREKDWVHLVLAHAKLANPSAMASAYNFVNWEQANTSAERRAVLPELDTFLVADADCVIVKLCENIQTYTTLTEDFRELIQYVRSKCKNAKVFVGGSWWNGEFRDDKIKAACDAEGVTFSSQSHLYTVENQCGLGTIVKGDDGQDHVVDNAGVAGHPGDKGMQEIAKIFINQIGL